MSQLILIEGLDEEDWIKSMYIQYIIHSLFTATRLHVLFTTHYQAKEKLEKNVIFNYKMKRLLCIYCSKNEKKAFLEWIFNKKNLKFKMLLDFIYVYQYHSSKKKLAKNSTNNLSFEIYMQIFKLCDIHYFVRNIVFTC
jgi:hypothetical protein